MKGKAHMTMRDKGKLYRLLLENKPLREITDDVKFSNRRTHKEIADAIRFSEISVRFWTYRWGLILNYHGSPIQ